MTGISYPEQATGRHIDASRRADRLARSLRPAAFLQWMLVICLALVLWPSQFGGAFGMVIVAGNSMEPTYDLGDAVITWRESPGIGDTVLFQVPDGEFGERNAVIHRIVGGDPGGWITQGDNSYAEDQWQPTNAEILGVAKFHVPFGGRLLGLLRNWLFISVLGGIATVLLLWPDPLDEQEEAKRGRHLAPTGSPS